VAKIRILLRRETGKFRPMHSSRTKKSLFLAMCLMMVLIQMVSQQRFDLKNVENHEAKSLFLESAIPSPLASYASAEPLSHTPWDRCTFSCESYRHVQGQYRAQQRHLRFTTFELLTKRTPLGFLTQRRPRRYEGMDL
jgi:hypothetical protein